MAQLVLNIASHKIASSNVGLGSTAADRRRSRCVRYASDSERIADMAAGLQRARKRHLRGYAKQQHLPFPGPLNRDTLTNRA